MKDCKMLLKAVAWALILWPVFVTAKQAQGCDIIGLQDGDCESNRYGVAMGLSLMYILINLLLAIGFIIPFESLVVVGLGFEFCKNLLVIISYPIWPEYFPWFLGYSKALAAWMCSNPSIDPRALAMIAVGLNLVGLIILTGIFVLILYLEYQATNTLPRWIDDIQEEEEENMAAGGDAK